MKKLMKMLEEKESNMKGKMSPEKSKAKMDVLKELMSMADSGEVGSMAEGLQKVTVAAKDKSGLEKGLEKAKEVVEGMPEMEDEEEEDKEEGGPLSPEEEEMLKKLLARKS
jgi:hypothetical protein